MWTLLLRLHMQLLQHLFSSRRSAGDLLSDAAAHLHASSIQRLLEVNQSDNQHICQISTDLILVLVFVHALRLALAHS